MWRKTVLFVICVCLVQGKLDSDEVIKESAGDHDFEDRSDKIGASVTQIYTHPYTSSLLRNGSYVCGAVILNTYWLLTASKCFDSDVVSSYVTRKNLGNFTIRTGSSYNTKGGAVNEIKMLINNFDHKVSAIKLEEPLEFGPRLSAVRLPEPEDDVSLGYLAAIIAWTPTGHIRVVNAPIIEPSICEAYTKMVPGNYICMGGVQDPNRHFCRKDNGGAVIQNDTLVGVASFIHSCALYSKTHAFPKVASFSTWLQSVIWDETNRPTTTTTTADPPTSSKTSKPENQNSSEIEDTQNPFDPSNYLLTLPFEPINVPLEPAEDNSVLPRMSLYESYLHNIARGKTSTTQDPAAERMEEEKKEWMKKFGKPNMMMPHEYEKKFGQYDYIG